MPTRGTRIPDLIISKIINPTKEITVMAVKDKVTLSLPFSLF